MNRKAVFLDRDGVINRALVIAGRPYPPSTLAELEILPGVESALAHLHTDYLLIVVTNQPDVARGTKSKGEVEAINCALAQKLPIDEFCVCYHDETDRCHCRKPAPGLLLQAAERQQIDLPKSFMIGDRWRDIEGGYLAGCRTFFIDYGYKEKQPEQVDYVVSSLEEASRIIMQLNGE